MPSIVDAKKARSEVRSYPGRDSSQAGTRPFCPRGIPLRVKTRPAAVPGTAPAPCRHLWHDGTGITVTRTDVTFDSAGITLAGHLYTPDGPAADGPATVGPRPAVIVGHTASGVKEQ